MDIIIITITEGPDGRPLLNVTPSDNTDPARAAEACLRVAQSFREAAIEAEVERRIAERIEADVPGVDDADLA